MSRNIDIDELKSATDKLVKEAKLSPEEYDELIDSARAEMEERGNIPEDMIDYYVYKRVQLKLKVRFSASSSEMEGFFLGYHAPFDFAAKPRQKVLDFIQRAGKEKALELGLCDSTLVTLPYTADAETGLPVVLQSSEDLDTDKYVEAPAMDAEELEQAIVSLGEIEEIKQNYMNKEHKFLYVNDQFREGQEIPRHDWNTVAYAIVKAPGDEDLKMATVNIRGNAATEPIPLYTLIGFTGRINQKKSTDQHYEMSMKGELEIKGDEIDYWDYDEIVRACVPQRRLDGLDEVRGFTETRQKEYKRWCLVQADIMEIGVGGGSDVPVTVTDFSLASFKSNESDITFWAPSKIAEEVQEGTLDAILLISPYIKRDGIVSGNLIGCWVDPSFRPIPTEDVDEEAVLDPF